MSEESGSYKRRVTPNVSRPRLSSRLEAKLAPADEASAKGYDALEEAGEKLAAITEAIASGAINAELQVTESLVVAITAPPAKSTT